MTGPGSLAVLLSASLAASAATAAPGMPDCAESSGRSSGERLLSVFYVDSWATFR